VKALIHTGEDFNYDLQVLMAVEAVNQAQKSVLFQKVHKYFKGDLKDKTIAVWGLSFKPQTDDMREAPSVVIINKLLEAGAKVKAYDPIAMKEATHQLGDTITYAEDQYEALIDADCLLLVTEWPEFKFPNFKIVKKLLNMPVIFDGRNIYEMAEMKRQGFEYFCIGVDTTK
jgi:UDPglucose 6-dehydrogenase